MICLGKLCRALRCRRKTGGESVGGIIVAAVLLTIVFAFSIVQRVVYRRNWRSGLDYNVQFSRNVAFEGEKITMTDCLANAKRLPLPWVHVNYSFSRHLELLDNVTKYPRWDERSLVYTVGVNKTVSRKSTVLCGKRGYYPVTDFVISCNNMLVSELSREKLDMQYSVTVYPKIVDYDAADLPLRRISGYLLARRFINPDPFEFRGIREYQPFDSFRQINFKATAKTGELMSNMHDFTVSQDITVILNLQPYCAGRREFVHEEAIRLAAFFCRCYVNAGVAVSFVGPAGVISSGQSKSHLETIYTALAHIDIDEQMPPIAELIPKGREKVYVLISSYHGEDLAQRVASMRRSDSDVLWLIPVCENDEISIATGEDIIRWEVEASAETQ